MAEILDPALATAGKSCDLGNDPSKYLERFNVWYEHTSLLADSIGVKDDTQKLRLTLLWGGTDFRKFAQEAGVVLTGDEHDTLNNAITKIKTACGKHVNLAMAVYKLMHAKQGTKTVTEFAKELDELATQCQLTEKVYTKDRAMKDAMIFGTSDDKLRQEALAKDFDYNTLVKVALGYEQSRKASGTIRSNSTEEIRQLTHTQAEVDQIVARVLAGKYSARRNQGSKQESPKNKCKNCPPHYKPHEPSKCPAQGKTCVVCKKKNHFAGSHVCQGGNTVGALDEEDDTHPYNYDTQPLGRLDVIEIGWLATSNPANQIFLKINNNEVAFYVDSGCKKTIIPQSYYAECMGKIKPSKTRFRPYGTQTHITTLGEIQATLQAKNGAQRLSTIYVVKGHQIEALLGDEDAKALGILTINKGGYHARGPISQAQSRDQTEVASITTNIQAAGIQIQAEKEPEEPIPPEENLRVQAIVEKHQEAFLGIGLLKNEEVSFHIDHTVPPVAAAYRPVPLAYREKLSAHLQTLREEDKIEDVDSDADCPWISNVVITEKKQKGQIRMNIDMREANKALHRTKRHVETIQEIRHKLEGATRFSEMDMGHGYHQIALAEDSRPMGTFQTHEGLHRFKVLFFGASPATELFHDRIKAALAHLTGCTSIHDNILVWGRTAEEHEANLDACLTRIEEKGLTLRKEKCTFGATSVSWFGTIFSKSGMSADPKKIQAIKEAGPPLTADDVKSFLQACQFNARFMYNTESAYAQITKPLRELTRKHRQFNWTPPCEQAYQEILQTMTSSTALRPFNPNLKTMHITDAGPEGIASSIFQETSSGKWIPIDHASRALTPCEQRYSQTEKESLAQSWGMNNHRYYLLGIPFDSYTDHQPLIHIYNGKKRGNARVERHRLKVQGFQYTMKYMPGKTNPCDYQSRHPLPLSRYTDRELNEMVIDHGDELCISKIVTDDLPDAVTLKMVQQATQQDPAMQKLIACINRGYITDDKALHDYRQVFLELTHWNGVILRGDRLLIPDAEVTPGTGSLRQQVVDTAHEGHQGAVKCKQLLRAKLWFPHLDKMVETRLQNCLGCQATTYKPTRDPLKPTPLPERPWQHVDMDFWGPLPSGEHLLVIIDEYSRYPEVEFVRSTSAQAVIPHLDRVFSTHGFPETVKTDGGPPFNGHEYQQYMQWAGIRTIMVSPEDPEANGLAENFMKAMNKIWHIAHIEGKNHKQELYKFLRHYRATPHSSTGRAPAEVLFNRKFQGRLPQKQEPAHNTQIRRQDQKAKDKQKKYKDAKTNTKPHNIKIGDQVLLLQKQTKAHPRYDPDPYKVIAIQGTQITAARGSKIRKRDAQRFKVIAANPVRMQYRNARNPLNLHKDDTFTYDHTTPVPHPIPAPQPIPQQLHQPEAPQPIPQQLHQPEARPQHRQHDYPNGHLDPNINPNLPREHRNRNPPKHYNPHSGSWT